LNNFEVIAPIDPAWHTPGHPWLVEHAANVAESMW